MMSSN
jgi:hypothetical protein